MIDFNPRLKSLKAQWWQRQILLALAIAMSVFAIIVVVTTGAAFFSSGSWFQLDWGTIAFIAMVSFLLSLLQSRFSHHYLALSLQNLLLHINRVVPQTEESSELLLSDQQQLNPLQRLQKQRVENAIAQQQSAIDDALASVYEIKPVLRLLGFMSLVALTVLAIKLMVLQHTSSTDAEPPVSNQQSTIDQQKITWQVNVTPPQYTKLASWNTTELNIEAPQGSKLEWVAITSAPVSLALRLAQQEPLAFVRTSENRYTAEWALNASTLYSIEQDPSGITDVPEIYTISMLRDRAPNIQIEQPLATVSEYNKSELPIVDVRVNVHDDYALSDIYISASIAKGTGEAVKFRDAEFQFDTDTEVAVDGSGMYRSLTKRWNFEALDMEPGDELYFSVIAKDIRQPEPQVTQSNTKILKWLDDDEVGITSDGILIDFIPEYFKSQRQIIIETIELIDRQPLLSYEEFEQTSRDLALAQSDLKQRYGQYLGDEFESGVMQTMESGPTIPDADDHVHDEHEHEGEHQSTSEQDTHEHAEHSHADGQSDEPSLSGYDEIIDQFGHNHGEADVGFILLKQGQLNPKALMKQSLMNMWQAELFLHLADPKNALPYEQKALDYLNRARKAERVYVKRLGFKPPPVTEERRYDGDLSDILAPKITKNNALELPFEHHIQHLLTRLSDLGAIAQPVTPEDKALLQQINNGLSAELAVSENTQQTLEVMSILERISLQQQWEVDDCDGCIDSLIGYFWHRLPPPIAAPSVRVGNAPIGSSLSAQP